MPDTKRPIGVDLFAGAGGMSLGFEQAGFDVLAAVELDPIHCATHEFNFPFCQVFCQSVVATTAEEIRSKSNIANQDIDVVFGGPPCQGFSLIGKRTLDDPRNTLVFHFLRLVTELQPKFFVLENVPGLTIGKHKKFLLEIIEEFTASGYQVKTDYQVLNACHYGVPQNRSRLFLIGVRQGLSLPEYPQKVTCINYPDKSIIFDDKLRLLPCPTVSDAIADLPDIELYPELLTQDCAIAQYGEPSDYAKKLRGFAANLDDYAYDRLSDTRWLTSSRRSQHTPQSINRFADTKPGEIEPISRFYKLHPQGICNTLRAGTPSNRGAFTSPRPIHPHQPRCITVREAARLHSYPDWFRFHVTKWHGFRQVGNSVPPLLAKAVATEIIQILGIVPIKPPDKLSLENFGLLQKNMSQAAKYYDVDSRVIEPRIKKKY